MSVELIVAVFGILLTTAFAIYAINDVRREVKKVIKLGRDLAYLRVKNDVAWEFIDPTDDAFTPKIGLGLNEFGLLAQALNPDWTDEHIKTSVENESLQFAEKLVENNIATWKKDCDAEKVRSVIKSWQAEKNIERVKIMMGVKDTSII
jgi:hypothetical protein